MYTVNVYKNPFERKEIKWKTSHAYSRAIATFTKDINSNITQNREFDQYIAMSDEWHQQVDDGYTIPNVTVGVGNSFYHYIASGPYRHNRVGNVIYPEKVEGTITLLANSHRVLAVETQMPTEPQLPISRYLYTSGEGRHGGEAVIQTDNKCCTKYYVRTTYRVVIVKDMQALSGVETIHRYQLKWNDVFEDLSHNNEHGQPVSGENWSHCIGPCAFVKEGVMDRYKILYDELHTVGSKEPQKIVRFCIDGKDIGPIRYQGPQQTDKHNTDVFVIWSSITCGSFVDKFAVSPETGMPDIYTGIPVLTYRAYWTG